MNRRFSASVFLFGHGLIFFGAPSHVLSVRAVVQRVSSAHVKIDNIVKGQIERGLVVLVAAAVSDSEDDVRWMSGKIVRMRVFEDKDNLMNRSILDIGGDLLVISQFTLFASTKKGNRPSFLRSAKPDVAIPLYESLLRQFESDLGKSIATGEFGADMDVSLTNDGPVTIILDSKNRE